MINKRLLLIATLLISCSALAKSSTEEQLKELIKPAVAGAVSCIVQCYIDSKMRGSQSTLIGNTIGMLTALYVYQNAKKSKNPEYHALAATVGVLVPCGLDK